MGVYIKNAKMPRNCAACPRKIFDPARSEYHCLETQQIIPSMNLSTAIRPAWCPLKEIKEPHGRLGDLDELRNQAEQSRVRNPHDTSQLRRNHDAEHRHFLNLLANTPTVLPAEGGAGE